MNRVTTAFSAALLVALSACSDADEGGTTVTDTGGSDTATADIGGTDVGTDVSEDTGTDAEEDTGTDAREDTGADAGEDTGADAGEDTGADAGEDTGADAGEDTGPICGDGTLDDGEGCDDGGVEPGDGCSTECAVEPELDVEAEVTLRDFPVAGVNVIAYRVTADGEEDLLTEVGRSVTRTSDGTTTFEGLYPGTYRFVAEHMETVFEPSSADVELTDEASAVSFAMISSTWPTGPDTFGESGYEAPFEIAVGDALRAMTIDEDGGFDWFAVELEVGVTYEIFTTNLNESADTYLEQIINAEGTVGDSNDDWTDLDSNIQFTPEETGTYVFRARHYNYPCSAVAYVFGVLELVDEDEDDFGAFHDCDDDDDTIYPESGNEQRGNDVDEDCDGVAEPLATSDDGIDDDTRETATPLLPFDVSFEERIYNGTTASASLRTVNEDDEFDWFSFEVSAHGKVLINTFMDESVDGSIEIFADGSDEAVLSADLDDSEHPVVNAGDEPALFFARVSLLDLGEDPPVAADPFVYALQLVDLGVDLDGDDYFTRDYGDEYADADDTDDEVGECTDIPFEGRSCPDATGETSYSETVTIQPRLPGSVSNSSCRPDGDSGSYAIEFTPETTGAGIYCTASVSSGRRFRGAVNVLSQTSSGEACGGGAPEVACGGPSVTFETAEDATYLVVVHGDIGELVDITISCGL